MNSKKEELISINLKFFILFISTLLFSCNKHSPENNYYVISEEIKNKPSLNDKYGILKYGDFNIVLIDLYRTAIHTKNSQYGNDDYIDENDELLPFLQLEKKDFKIMSTYDVLKFINSNICDSVYENGIIKKRKTFVTISSFLDTIDNVNFVLIKQQLVNQGVDFFYIRKTTEEEFEVLNSIDKGLCYDSKKIKWKTKFKKVPYIFRPPY